MFDISAMCLIDESVKTGRISSWDQTGANKDCKSIGPHKTLVIGEIEGAGIIRHIWITVACEDVFYLRKLLIRMYWDGSNTPSVQVPLGDFFGVGHARMTHYVSVLTNVITNPNMLPYNGAMNCFFPMPFASGARIEIVNDCDVPVDSLYYYIDYEKRRELPNDLGRFHATWRRENPCDGWVQGSVNQENVHEVFGTTNLSDAGNYVILDVNGTGQYVGCNVSVHNLAKGAGWFGEGDDMIFIDGNDWPPELHGTGTEDYFCAAWGFPSGKYDGPFHGISVAGNTEDYSGQWTMYRYHVDCPIRFTKSIRVSIEHGHANSQSDDWASTAYWYQLGVNNRQFELPRVQERLPRTDSEYRMIADRITKYYKHFESVDATVRNQCHRLLDLVKQSLAKSFYVEASRKLDEIRHLLNFGGGVQAD